MQVKHEVFGMMLPWHLTIISHILYCSDAKPHCLLRHQRRSDPVIIGRTACSTGLSFQMIQGKGGAMEMGKGRTATQLHVLNHITISMPLHKGQRGAYWLIKGETPLSCSQ